MDSNTKLNSQMPPTQPAQNSRSKKVCYCPYCGNDLMEQKNQEKCDNCQSQLNIFANPLQAASNLPVQGIEMGQVLGDFPNQNILGGIPIQNQQNILNCIPVPGATEIGMEFNQKCEFNCSNLAISKCNLHSMQFTGCNKCFCRDHGYPHFSGLMINPSKLNVDINYVRDQDEKEELQEKLKFVNRDRQSNISFLLRDVRVCENCFDNFQKAMKKSRKQWCLRSVGLAILILFLIIIIIIIGESQFDDEYQYSVSESPNSIQYSQQPNNTNRNSGNSQQPNQTNIISINNTLRNRNNTSSNLSNQINGTRNRPPGNQL